MPFDWNANYEITQRVKALWVEGVSAREISEIVGNGISRNAIIGFVGRAGLVRHGQAGGFYAARPKSKPLPKPKPKKTTASQPEPLLAPEEYAGSNQCQFIHGDPSYPTWRMCGHPIYAERPKQKLCEFHWQACIDHVGTKKAKGHG